MKAQDVEFLDLSMLSVKSENLNKYKIIDQAFTVQKNIFIA